MRDGVWYGRRAWPWLAAGAAAALVPAVVMWGFTVDDALIPIRYAHHIASGVGYRFSPHAAPSDGVTPLPWAFLLVPLAGGDPLDALLFAKALGVLAWTLAGAALGARVRAALPLLVMALAFEIGAWAASGLETGLVTALATLAAVSLERPRRAAALAGAAAALRPELAPWAVVLAGGAALDREGPVAERRREAVRSGALAVGPFAACALARAVAFGRPAPLAVLAKPSDLAHGATYAAAAAVVLLLPLVACAPLAVARRRGPRTIALAFLVHLAAVALAGGDWMPYARLVVPVAPSLALVYAAAAQRPPRRLDVARACAAVALGVYVAVRAAPAGRHVLDARTELVRAARPELASSRVVAALDVGWVSAAVGPDADVVDLAGLTDPSIAVLPGGHTSKRVDVAMLLDRGVDAVIVYRDPRVVEERLLRSPLFDERYARRATLPLGYAVFRRR
jgi:hypothetical protein